MAKTLDVIIQNKYDTEENWNKKDPVILKGEVIFYESEDSTKAPRMKIGDEYSHKSSELSFVENNNDNLIRLPYPNIVESEIEYTGTVITPKVQFIPGSVQLVKEEPRINSGEYTQGVIPNSGFCWQDGSTDQYNIPWRIVPQKVTLTPVVDKTVFGLYDGVNVTIEASNPDIWHDEVWTDSVSLAVTIKYGQGNYNIIKNDNIGKSFHVECYATNSMMFELTPTTNSIFNNYTIESKSVEIRYIVAPGGSLEQCSWEQISNISAEGIASSVFAIGDTKTIKLDNEKFTVGAQGSQHSFGVTKVYIIGFDHNCIPEISGDLTENSGITFACFKSDNNYTAIYDNHYLYGKDSYNNVELKSSFSMNHCRQNDSFGSASDDTANWGPASMGGWETCDLRFDILGSTDIKPIGYDRLTNEEKYNDICNLNPLDRRVPSSNCLTSPLSGTFMSGLPDQLRNVMKLISKWTPVHHRDVNGSYHIRILNTNDYLPFLSEREVFGENKLGISEYTDRYQKIYEFFKNSNPRIRMMQNRGNEPCRWWLRDQKNDMWHDRTDFLAVSETGSIISVDGGYSCCLAPIFLV